MKKMNFLVLFILFSASAVVNAQVKDSTGAPVNVVKAFQTAHPQATDVAWDKEGLNYEADYKENGSSYSVVINNTGKILETESEIKTTDLPAGVIKYINDNYSGYTISGAAKIVDVKGNVKYEAEIKKGNSSKDVMFDKDGQPLKQAKEKNENKEEEEDNDQD